MIAGTQHGSCCRSSRRSSARWSSSISRSCPEMTSTTNTDRRPLRPSALRDDPRPSPGPPRLPWYPAWPQPSSASFPSVCRTSGSPRVGRWMDGDGPTSRSPSSGRPHRASRQPGRVIERRHTRRCARPSQRIPSGLRSRRVEALAPSGEETPRHRRGSRSSWSASQPPGMPRTRRGNPCGYAQHATPTPSRPRCEADRRTQTGARHVRRHLTARSAQREQVLGEHEEPERSEAAPAEPTTPTHDHRRHGPRAPSRKPPDGEDRGDR